MKRKAILIFSVLVLALFVAGCASTTSSTEAENKYTEETMQEINRQIGMPEIDNFFEKKLAKEIFELRDNSKLVTYAYLVNLDGKFVYLGRTLGFGLPYSVQYTSPEKLIDRYGRNIMGSSRTPYILPQADPNGLYMPDGLSATWLMLINEQTGNPEIIYTEPSIVVTQSKLPKRLVTSWSLPKNY